MLLSAERLILGERQVPDRWNVVGVPSVEGGGFIWPAHQTSYSYVVPSIKIEELTPDMAERLHEGDMSVYQEIADGPDDFGCIRLLGCYAMPPESIWGGRNTSNEFREFAPFVATKS